MTATIFKIGTRVFMEEGTFTRMGTIKEIIANMIFFEFDDGISDWYPDRILDHCEVLEEHQKHQNYHKNLHNSLDELITDFTSHTGKLLSKTSIAELMVWSYQQTTRPTP